MRKSAVSIGSAPGGINPLETRLIFRTETFVVESKGLKGFWKVFNTKLLQYDELSSCCKPVCGFWGS